MEQTVTSKNSEFWAFKSKIHAIYVEMIIFLCKLRKCRIFHM